MKTNEPITINLGMVPEKCRKCEILCDVFEGDTSVYAELVIQGLRRLPDRMVKELMMRAQDDQAY